MEVRGKMLTTRKKEFQFYFIYFIKYASEIVGYGMYNMDLVKYK